MKIYKIEYSSTTFYQSETGKFHGFHNYDNKEIGYWYKNKMKGFWLYKYKL